ncbi:hypothetical protein [Flavobacterium sp. HSC-61S13]|uniref:hypothetical protein n=1 Tax=Flavobacterium sp. HSC-61S13 TaxID=2910963 RepID=UPI0020A0AC64|nr:hypothetical protein [Flavobacterium sp. HSC-61S13]MCP1997505.1 hypothetical protein [Flavobacterium sp. HSC-61S13]
MKKYAFIAIASVAFLTSCNDTKKEAVTEDPTATETPVTNAAPAGHSEHDGHDHGTTQQAEGMNPEHGQPGHRCDIPVGAPLNSPAATQPNAAATSAPAQAQQPFLVNDGAKGATSAATGNLNPEHGQPGHRCDIAVGQPLS